ncbi:MAG: hypothetical protein NTY01_04870 [Verrucomicrobia bacterium]|nr:hypothetical protein [Verrucomicrobiota bacterium]
MADTYTAWAQSLQVTRYRISGEIAPAQERLAQIQQEVDQAKQGLADLAAQLKQQQSSRGKIRVDPVAQGNRNTYELTVLKGTTAINKQTRNIASLREQLNTLEVDISRIQSRMPTPTILRVTQARCGSKDVTRAAQDLVRGDRATIRASADSFGLRQDQFPDAALKISYELRGEKKEVSVPQGWTVKLPSAELIAPPPQAPEPPWYEKHAMWLAGGVLALLLIITTFWQPKSKKPEL